VRLWRRIARLLRQSRIRLPRRPLEAPELRSGDWVQLGARTWQVIGRRFDSDRVRFRLRAIDGRGGAVLSGPLDRSAEWTVEHEGQERPIPPELLVVFPLV